MASVCSVSHRVRTFPAARLLSAAAFTLLLIASLGPAAASQTTAKRASAFTPASALASTPLVSGSLEFLPPVYSDGGSIPDSGSQPLAIADVNADGNLDVAVVNAVNTVSVLLGKGDGTFQAPRTLSPGMDVYYVTLADVNGDGKPDVIVAGCVPQTNSCVDAVAVMLGNGDGTFKAPVSYSPGGVSPNQIVVADLNLDGAADLVVLNICLSSCTSASSGSVSVLLGKGDGTFGSPVAYSTAGHASNALVVSDLNGDGKPDLVVTNGCTTPCSTYDKNHQVTVLLGNGDGTFKAAVGYPSGGFVTGRAVATDLNGDGKVDLAVLMNCNVSPCPAGSDSYVGVLLGNGDGTFQAPTTYDAGGVIARFLIATDVNGDGKLDLLLPAFCNDTSCSGEANLYALMGNGDGTFQASVLLYFIGPFGGQTALSEADMNNDGKPDLVIAHGCSDISCAVNDTEVGVMLNNSGAPKTTTTVTASKNPIQLFTTVTYTATVTGGSGGSVTFADGGAPLSTVALSGTKATYSTTYRAAGTHGITATYSGVLHTEGSSRSTTLTETVANPTTTVLTTSGSPSFVGQPVTFTATVTSKYGAIPNGDTVKFYDGNTLLASVALSSGKATFTTSSLTAKTHGMKAVYSGDATFYTSTGFVTQVVNLYSTTTTLTCSPNPSTSGQLVTMKATVTSAGPATPTGKVIFKDGTTQIGAATLTGGFATITKSTLTVGTHSITATYNGDSKSAASTSTVVKQVVN